MVKNFLNDECGAIVSIEMIIIITVAVLALIVGWSEVAVAINSELDDISNAVGKLDQSYFFVGFGSSKINGQPKTYFHGATFVDAPDDCDNGHGLVCATGTEPTGNG